MKPDKRTSPWLAALGILPTVWLALLLAPFVSDGLAGIIAALPGAMNHPFKIIWWSDIIKPHT